jgi:predicted RNase H-like nuclease (RuvC/YqgF family)
VVVEHRALEERFHDAQYELGELRKYHENLLAEIRTQQQINERLRLRAGRARTAETRLVQQDFLQFNEELETLRAECRNQRRLVDRLKRLLMPS